MLTQNQINEIREELDNCARPIFLYDDDQDGLCSFLLLYRYKREGKGMIIKTTPKIDERFIEKVNNYQPDKIFILDIAMVEQEFIDGVKAPVVWIDHHEPLKRSKVKYYNPRLNGKMVPTTYMCYKITGNSLWIAMIGCVADWHIPDFADEFKEKFPDLLDKPFKAPGDIIYKTRLGKLIQMFSFLLKGKSEDVNNSIKILTRIEGPYDILEPKTPEGKFLCKRCEKIHKRFEPLQKEISEAFANSKEKLIVFKYAEDRTSFTSELSNEMIYLHPEKIVLVAREKNEEMKCSLRSAKIVLPPLINKAMAGLNGYGGGHEHACGINISKYNFEEFVERLRKAVE